MKSLLKIYGRYIGVTWIIIIILILANLGGLMAFGISRMIKEDPMLSRGLGGMETLIDRDKSGEDFVMTKEIEKYLEERKFVFLLVLNEEGEVVYSWNKPEGFKERYSLGEVAAFTRWYLHDYPVKVLRTEKGLLVAGRPKGTMWKYSIEVSEDLLRSVLVYGQIFLVLNLAVVLLVVFFLGYRYYKSLSPLSKGIRELSENRKVHLEEKGVAASLASQINRASDVLEFQRTALNKRDMARTEWIAGVSHDIRTPLTMIMGYADELESSESLPEEERGKAAVIKSQSLKIRQLIEDLNLTSKLEYHMQPLRTQSFYPAVLLRQLAAEIINEEPGEQYEFLFDIAPELEGVTAQGDERLLARAVRNLLNNSVRHNPEGCRIFLEGGRRNQEGCQEGCFIRVRDDGKGIPDEVAACLSEERRDGDVFDREAFGAKGKPHIMGLRIVKQIALAHKGTFEIGQEGHCVSIWIP